MGAVTVRAATGADVDVLPVIEAAAGERFRAIAELAFVADHDPSFAPAWTNLGILYARAGQPLYAEAAHPIEPPPGLVLHRHARAGQVHYHLLTPSEQTP